MKKIVVVLLVFIALIALATLIVGADYPFSERLQTSIDEAIKITTEVAADLGLKRVPDSDFDAVLTETVEAMNGLEKHHNEIKEPSVRPIIVQVLREFATIRELIELTKREYAWNDVYGCPQYNGHRIQDSLRKIDEILKKLAEEYAGK